MRARTEVLGEEGGAELNCGGIALFVKFRFWPLPIRIGEQTASEGQRPRGLEASQPVSRPESMADVICLNQSTPPSGASRDPLICILTGVILTMSHKDRRLGCRLQFLRV